MFYLFRQIFSLPKYYYLLISFECKKGIHKFGLEFSIFYKTVFVNLKHLATVISAYLLSYTDI